MALFKFILRRLFLAVVMFLVITAALYGIMMLAPAEARAMMYMPSGGRGNDVNLIKTIIREHGLDDPYPVQYVRWLLSLVQGDWGWSPTLSEEVLAALVKRTPVTIELTLYSVLLFIPIGLISGVVAGWKRGRPIDHGLRLVAFIGTSIPPFIMGLILLAIFYVGLHWFMPGRISISNELDIRSDAFRTITGLLTVDGLLNSRPDITVDALRHLALPVFSLSLAHWATLMRVTRTAIIEELDKEYVTAAWGRGLPYALAVWRHALRNAMVPALNSSALSAAALVTGVFVVEIVFSLPGVSKPLTQPALAGAFFFAPDVAAMMGFAVYGMFMVLPLMVILDFLQAVIDPRIREGVLS
ncbi:MAG: ABC transporter permease [Anaerolineae bacterium]|jgi:ABC-type dipeptide/oligopeptide/nickel transport system permease component